jgi:hypothetical protein
LDDETADEFFDRMSKAQEEEVRRRKGSIFYGQPPEPEGMKHPKGPPGMILFSSAAPRVAPYAQPFYAHQAYQGQPTGGGGSTAAAFGGLGGMFDWITDWFRPKKAFQAPMKAFQAPMKAFQAPLSFFGGSGRRRRIFGMFGQEDQVSYLDANDMSGLGAQEWVKIFAPWAGGAEIFQKKEEKGIAKQAVKMALVQQTTAKQTAALEAERQQSVIRARAEVEKALAASRAMGVESDKAAREAHRVALELGNEGMAADARSLIEALGQVMSAVNSVRTAGISDPAEIDALRVDLGAAASALGEINARAQEIRFAAVGQVEAIRAAELQAVAARQAEQKEFERLQVEEEAAQRRLKLAEARAALEAERIQAEEEFAEIRRLRDAIARERKLLAAELAEARRMGVA